MRRLSLAATRLAVIAAGPIAGCATDYADPAGAFRATDLPAGWRVERLPSGALIAPPEMPRATIVVASAPRGTEGRNLETATRAVDRQLKALDGFQPVGRRSRSVAGRPATTLSSRFALGGDSREQSLTVVEGSKAMVFLACNAPRADWHRVVESCDRALAGLEVR